MAYINPQFAIDQEAEQRRVQHMDNAVNAFSDGMSKLEENRRRALDLQNQKDLMAKQVEKENLGFAKDGISKEVIDKYRNTGDSTEMMAKYAEIANQARARKAEDSQLDREAKIATIAANKATAEDKLKPWKESRDGQAHQAKLDLENNQRANQEAKEVAKKNVELEVPGYGLVRTAKEASEIRAAKADADDAAKLLDDLKALGKDVAVWDREKINKINQLKTVIAGKLRLPLTGPGAMTEDEFQRLVTNIGDPSDLFSTEATANAKIDQLKGVLTNSVKSKFNAAAMPNQAQAPTIEQKRQRLEELRRIKASQNQMVGQR